MIAVRYDEITKMYIVFDMRDGDTISLEKNLEDCEKFLKNDLEETKCLYFSKRENNLCIATKEKCSLSGDFSNCKISKEIKNE